MFFPLMYSGDTQNTSFGHYHTWTCPHPSVGQCISEWHRSRMGTQIQQLISYLVLHM